MIENNKTIPNPDSELLDKFKEMFVLEVKEPIYLSQHARMNMGRYNEFANTLIFDSWLLDDAEMRHEVHIHELAHALQAQYNKRLVKRDWEQINRKRSDNPDLGVLLNNFGKVRSLLKLQGSYEENSYIIRLYNAMGVMIYLFMPRKKDGISERWEYESENLTEGFAEWVTAKIVPCQIEREAKREAALQTFTRLEERLGQARTLRIALSASSDKEFYAITSQYL